LPYELRDDQCAPTAARPCSTSPGGTDCPEANNQLDSMLAHGQKNGYVFTPHASFSGNKPEMGFWWNADPISQGTGTRHFFVDQTGVIRFSKTAQADETSPPLM